MNRLQIVAAAIVCGVLTGCANISPMAFDRNASSVDTSAKSIVLMTIDVYRGDDSRYVPHPTLLLLTKPNGSDKEEALGFRITENVDAVAEEGHKIYLARVALAPGQYKVVHVFGDANAFPFHGFFFVPIFEPLVVTPGSITYIGRVSATLRPRADGEFRAGPLLPLIDQSVTGVSVSTWEINIDNKSEQDLALYRSTYPFLAGAQIAVAPLPPFDRAAAQRRWDGTEEAKK